MCRGIYSLIQLYEIVMRSYRLLLYVGKYNLLNKNLSAHLNVYYEVKKAENFIKLCTSEAVTLIHQVGAC